MKTAVVVEDNSTIRALLETMFELQGFTVSSAWDGSSALEVLAGLTRPPALVLLDFHLPDTDTLQVARDVERRFPGVPVLLTSGLPLDLLPVAAAQYAFLPKPFTLDAVTRRVKSLVQVAPDLTPVA